MLALTATPAAAAKVVPMKFCIGAPLGAECIGPM